MTNLFLKKFLLILGVFGILTCYANDYYVDINSLGGNCSNNHPGTVTQPFCNVSKIESLINNGQLNPGDQIFIREGTYQSLLLQNISGTPGNYIVIRNYPGESPTIDAKHPNSASSEYGVRLRFSSYIEINGLEMINASGGYAGGIHLDRSDYNRILNNHIHHNANPASPTYTSGIEINHASHNLIQYNEVHDNEFTGIKTYTSNSGTLVATNNQILNNHVYNHSLNGGNSDGISFSGANTSNCIVSGNLVHHNEDDGIDTWSSNGHTITYNIVHSSGLMNIGNGMGFKLGGQNGGIMPGFHFVAFNISYDNAKSGFNTNGSGGSFLYNNVAYNNGYFGATDDYRVPGQTAVTTYRNNIFFDNNGGAIRTSSQFVANCDYNMYFNPGGGTLVLFNGTYHNTLAGYQSASGMEGNTLSVNPQFVDVVARDFHLLPSSPAIDVGDPTNPGGGTMIGVSTDMGVYEYGRNELSLRLILEGAYNSGSGLMNDILRAKNLLPVTNPWGQGPDISTTAYNVSGNDALVDWIQIELRAVNDYSTVLYSTSGLVQRDGDVVQSDGLSLVELTANLPANFYIVVLHKSHLAAMSHVPISVVNSLGTYDFTTQNGYTTSSSSQRELITGVWGLLTGTGSGDRDINGQDKVLWAAENGNFSIYSVNDFNLDADINAADKVMWSLNNGLFSEIP